MGKAYSRLRRWFSASSLTLVAIGLMGSSSGLDGVYMVAWMPDSVPWLGFLLNTMADIATLLLSKRYARLQRRQDPTKRHWSKVILAADIVAMFYSWLFSWRQLLRVMPLFEPDAWPWLAPLSAGFIPLMLGFIGYAQGLSDTRIEASQQTESMEQTQPVEEQVTSYVCETCGASYGSRNALNAHQRAHKPGSNNKEQAVTKERVQ